MCGSSNKQEETSAEREFAQIAREQFDRGRELYNPAIKSLIADVMDSKPELAKSMGTVNLATRQAFARGRAPLRASMPIAAHTQSSIDEGASLGLGRVSARNAVDTNKAAGLQTLMAVGQGESAGAMRGLNDVAEHANAQAQRDAAQSAADSAGYAEAAGSLAGAGMRAYTKYRVDNSLTPGGGKYVPAENYAIGGPQGPDMSNYGLGDGQLLYPQPGG